MGTWQYSYWALLLSPCYRTQLSNSHSCLLDHWEISQMYEETNWIHKVPGINYLNGPTPSKDSSSCESQSDQIVIWPWQMTEVDVFYLSLAHYLLWGKTPDQMCGSTGWIGDVMIFLIPFSNAPANWFPYFKSKWRLTWIGMKNRKKRNNKVLLNSKRLISTFNWIFFQLLNENHLCKGHHGTIKHYGAAEKSTSLHEFITCIITLKPLRELL